MKRVLILCTGNSCRSQMAELIWNKLAEGQWQAESAGSRPSGFVHPLAIAVLRELDFDTQQLSSKPSSQFGDVEFDLVVTVCDNAQADCPVWPNAKETLHWPFDDPAQAAGSEEQKMAVFRHVRDQIQQRIEQYLAHQRNAAS